VTIESELYHDKRDKVHKDNVLSRQCVEISVIIYGRERTRVSFRYRSLANSLYIIIKYI